MEYSVDYGWSGQNIMVSSKLQVDSSSALFHTLIDCCEKKASLTCWDVYFKLNSCSQSIRIFTKIPPTFELTIHNLQ